MEVPQEIAEYPHWILWRMEYGTKVPYQPSGHRARTNDQSTWSSLSELSQSEGYTGIAYVFSEDDPFCGIDLDDCLTDGVWEPWAQEILNRFEGVAYAEISPSGTGVKLTTKADKPAGSRCTNQKGVECYDHSRFWAWTGNCLGDGFESIGDGQAAVDWLIEKHLQGVERATGERRLQPAVCGSFELLGRAESYVDSCEAGRKGNLRNSAFNISGHLHSLIGHSGERLTDTDVYSMLRRWNARNSDQLRDDELQEAAVNGRKNGTPPADKPPEEPLVVNRDDSDVDLSGILSELIVDLPDDIPFSPGDFPRDAIPQSGIIGQIVAHNLSTAMYPQPELALAGALSLMSVVTGRKIEDRNGTRTNLYTIGLGESGSGKEHARKVNKNLLYAIGAESAIGNERFASHSGLMNKVRDSLSVLFQVDEIGHLLATMKNPNKSHLYNIGAVLMQMYSSADSIWIGDAYADAKHTPTIIQPHAVLYGTSTPSQFWENMTADSVSNGLLGRMIVFESPGRVNRRRPDKSQPSTKLIEELRWWWELRPGGIDKSNPIPITAEHTPEALERFERHQDAICERQISEPPDKAALWSRTAEKTAKLALIFACSRHVSHGFRIELEDVERAIKIANWLTRRMLRQAYDYVAANFVEENKKRVLRVIGEKSSGITMRSLSRRTQWLRAKERMEILVELQEREEIVIEEIETGGRPKRVVRRT